MISLSRVIKKFKEASKYNQCNMKNDIPEIEFIIAKEIDELVELTIIFERNESILLNGLEYKIISYEKNIPTYSDPISWLKLTLK